MHQSITTSNCVDTGLQSLITCARLHGIPCDAEQVRHRAGLSVGLFQRQDLLRAAKGLGFKVRVIQTDWRRLQKLPLPALARHKDGHWFVLARIADDKLLIQDPLEQRPLTLSKEVFEQSWSGEVLLLSRKGILGENGRFGLRWFIPALKKYKRLFGEVLFAAFLLQLFALVTPLFFQVVIDKVLVHKGLTTLDVLAGGFFILISFEVLIGGFRTYLFTHTTQRIDVELGGKLYRHLLGLPLNYFQSRRVGDSVARVRELDSVRDFLTGTALTLVIDLGFTFLFFIVMWHYSPTLTIIVLASIPFYILLAALITPVKGAFKRAVCPWCRKPVLSRRDD